MGNSTSNTSNGNVTSSLKDIIYTLTSAELTSYREEFFVTFFNKINSNSIEEIYDIDMIYIILLMKHQIISSFYYIIY